jgi:hypothetical protein
MQAHETGIHQIVDCIAVLGQKKLMLGFFLRIDMTALGDL